jgi:phosphatidylglycerophosphatase C
MSKEIVAAFDFDGTITNRDTFLAFIRFVKGYYAFYTGLLYFSPLLIAYKLKLYPNWKIKQIIFSWFFKGLDYESFRDFGNKFAQKNKKRILYSTALNALQNHISNGHRVYIVTASITDWVSPFFEGMGLHGIIGTEVSIDSNNCLTGTFRSKNCYGKEKIDRLLEKEPNRHLYELHAYGDSRGDQDLLEAADIKFYKEFHS